jgi:ATP10 protein
LTKRFVNEIEGEATHITNTQVGYTLLVDDKARIRWMATGLPWEGEKEALIRCIDRMIRMDKGTEYIEEESTVGEAMSTQAAI